MEPPPRVLRAYRFRLDTRASETDDLAWFAAARRKAWNWALALIKETLDLDRCADRLRQVDTRGKPYRYLDRFALIRMFTVAKPTLDWTREVPTRVFEYAFEDLCAALAAFVAARGTTRDVGFPTFIAAHQPATFTTRGAISVQADRLQLPRLPHLRVRGSTRRLERDLSRLHGTIREATVAQRHKHWWISVLVERDARAGNREVDVADTTVGLDVGLHTFLTRSDGVKVANPRSLRHAWRRTHRLAKSVGRSQAVREAAVALPSIMRHAELLEAWDQAGRPGEKPAFPRLPLPPKSHRHRKKERRYAAAQRRVADTRRTFHQQTAATLVPIFSVVGTEKLGIANLMRNHHLARSMADAGWGGFFHDLDSRAEDYGSLVVRADRFFASSQLCSACGVKNPAVKDLRVRFWTCPNCGAVHERDYNAATNLVPTPAAIAVARAQHAERTAKYQRRKEQIATRAKKAGATNRARTAKKQTSSRVAVAVATPALNPNLRRIPVFTGTPVDPIPGETLNRAWRPGKTVLGPARVSEALTDLVSELDVGPPGGNYVHK